MRNTIKRFVLIALPVFLLLFAACSIGEKNRREATEFRENLFAQAQSLYPEPRAQNFPLRQALIKFTEREDLINHPWYVYILGYNGNVIGYYVAQTVPVNSCTFLSSTEIIDDGAVVTAPSLDGIFYGGAGSAAGCDEWFFFDAETDAMIKIRGVFFYVADQPLRLEAEPILVKVD